MCGLFLVNAVRFGLAFNILDVELEAIADGQASFTNETSHTSSYSAK